MDTRCPPPTFVFPFLVYSPISLLVPPFTYLSFTVLLFPALSCSFMQFPALSCICLHFPALSLSFQLFPSLSCAFLHFPALFCSFLHSPCLFSSFLHFPALSCTFLHFPALSSTFLHFPALSCTLLHFPAHTCAPHSVQPGVEGGGGSDPHLNTDGGMPGRTDNRRTNERTNGTQFDIIKSTIHPPFQMTCIRPGEKYTIYSTSVDQCFLLISFNIITFKENFIIVKKVFQLYTGATKKIYQSDTASFIKPYRNPVYKCTGSR